jgi:hypothetical protein
MGILHQLRNLLNKLLSDWIARRTKLSYGITIPGLWRDLRLEPHERGLPAEAETRLEWKGLLCPKAVRLRAPIKAGKPRIHLSKRIKHRCLLLKSRRFHRDALEDIFNAMWSICMRLQPQLPHSA